MRHFRNCSVKRHLDMSAVSLTRIIHSYQSHANQFRDTMLPKSRKCMFRLFCLVVISFHAKLVLGCILGPEGLGVCQGVKLNLEGTLERASSHYCLKWGSNHITNSNLSASSSSFSIQLFHHTQVHLSNTIPSEFE